MSRIAFAATLLWLVAARATMASGFDLQTVEHLALQSDAGLAALSARAEALAEQAVAEAQLPDPKLKLGLNNFPTDTFHRRQEPMTQVQVGVVQAFPAPGTLGHREAQATSLARAADAAVAERRLALLRA
ncbi:MAG: TolC family protein, partial [Pseudomonadota bacterium]|nr:TolC family protein [Pseudomonadota bacterium]